MAERAEVSKTDEAGLSETFSVGEFCRRTLDLELLRLHTTSPHRTVLHGSCISLSLSACQLYSKIAQLQSV